MRRLIMLCVVLSLAGCESAYYGMQENVFGNLKNDLLKDRVEDAVVAQEDAKEEFQSALEQFEAVVGVPEGELKQTYNRLNDAYEDALSEAQDVGDRIDAVENVADDLFDEWEAELEEYSDGNLRRQSAADLKRSRQDASALVKTMRRAESRMEPVLDAFQDHVLYLKHNLNAQAISALRGELGTIENNVGRLIRDMEASIAEAREFIEKWDR